MEKVFEGKKGMNSDIRALNSSCARPFIQLKECFFPVFIVISGWNINSSQNSFLDTLLSRNNGFIVIDVFRKPALTDRYLDFNHAKRNIK